MKHVLGVLLGALCGFLIYMEAAMVFFGPPSGSPGGGFIAVTFLGGWAACSYLMIKGTKSATKVLARGSLIGAALWLFMIAAGVIFSGRSTSHTMETVGSEAGKAGAAVGGGLVAMITGGVSIAMTILCLISFAVFYFMGRELKPEKADEGPTRQCPQCAETVKAAASKCKHCGSQITPLAEISGGTIPSA